MPWCPKCKTEYREGYSKCSDCDIELVDKLIKIPEKPNVPNNFISAPIDPCFLVSVNNDYQAKLIYNMLQNIDIPCFFKSHNTSAYLNIYMGFSIYATNIFVNKKDYEYSKEIVDAFFNDQNFEELNDNVNNSEDENTEDESIENENDEEEQLLDEISDNPLKKRKKTMQFFLKIWFFLTALALLIKIIFKIIRKIIFYHAGTF